MTISYKHLSQLKKELESGEISTTLWFLSHDACDNDLKLFQEQKILLLSPLELLEITNETLEDYYNEVANSFWSNFQAKVNSGTYSEAEIADLTEWTLHELNGAVNEAFFAGARALNEAIILTNKMSMLRGAKISYQDSRGSTISTKQLAAGDELTTAEFLQFLREPLDWRIAKESDSIAHTWFEYEDIKTLIPGLKRDAPLL